jgi:integrase
MVFGAKADSALDAALDRIRQRAALQDFVFHDLRRTCATVLAKISVEPHLIGRLLNHAAGTSSVTEQVYMKYTYDAEKRAALLKLDRYIGELVHPRRLRVVEPVKS